MKALLPYGQQPGAGDQLPKEDGNTSNASTSKAADSSVNNMSIH